MPLLLLGIIKLLLAFLVILHIKLKCSYLYRSVEKQFKGPACWPLIGNALEFFSSDSVSFYPTIQKICSKYERFTRIWMGFDVYIFLSKPKDVEVLLNSQVEITKSNDYRFLYEWLGRGLLTSTGPKWRSRRKIITPAFHFKILDNFLQIFNANGHIFLEKLAERAGKGTFDLFNVVKLYTLDNICETALGVKINAQKDLESEYTKAVKEISAIVTERAFKFWLEHDAIFHLSKHGRRYRKALTILHRATESIIKERRHKLQGMSDVLDFEDDIGQKKKLAFLDLLLSEGLTDSDIKEEVDTFMFEGHDTVTSGITFIFYCLAHNPLAQETVYNEQMDIFGDSDRDPTMNDLQEMKFLEMVIKEGQRLYPSVPVYGRAIQDDLALADGYYLPKGCECYINAAKMHRDPEIWEKPDEFNPDNFLPEAIRNRHPFAFVPFSAGPRNCIGQKFAMMEMKSCIGKAVRKFKFLPSQDENKRVQLTSMMVLVSVNGVNIEVEERGQTQNHFH